MINLRGVELGVGPGEGVRYYKELRIKVMVMVRLRVKVRVRVGVKVKVRVMMGRTSLIPTRPTLTIKLYPPILSQAAQQAPDVF